MPPPHPALTPFISAVRSAVTASTDPADTAQRVAAALRVQPPPAVVVTASTPPARPRGQRLYVDPDGRFSIIGLRWKPGQSTRIHDHIGWGAVGVIAGVEREIMFDADLDPLGHTDFHDGEVTWFTPPGDIHQVHNVATTTAVSIHVYGADLRQADSSVRRYYVRRQLDDEAERPER
jgi:predicted metal-dependent enzyme (double-stranded beta helix superfamily)